MSPQTPKPRATRHKRAPIIPLHHIAPGLTMGIEDAWPEHSCARARQLPPGEQNISSSEVRARTPHTTIQNTTLPALP
eukprot:1656639-Rhodomonas_salina.2